MCGGLGDGLVEPGHQLGARIGGVGLQVISGSDRLALGLPDRISQPCQRILVGRPHLGGRQAKPFGDGAEHLLSGVRRDRDRFRIGWPGVGQQRDRRFQSGSPSVRHEAQSASAATLLPDDHLPWLRCTKPFGAETISAGPPERRHAGACAARRLRRSTPVDLVVDRDERRLAAHGEADVTGGQPFVDAGSQRGDGARAASV